MAGAPDDRRWQKMTDLILTIRPAPDGEADVAALGRRGVAALAAPVIEAAYFDTPPPAASSATKLPGGLIFTSRHGIAGFLRLFDGVLPPAFANLPVFVVGRASGRMARKAGFSEVTVGAGGGAGLVPLILARTLARRDLTGAPLLWPCAVHRGFDMQAALAPQVAVTMLPVYEMKPMPRFDDRALAALGDGRVGAVILMSARSARLFREMLARHDLEPRINGMALIAGSKAIADAAGSGWDEEFVARRSTRARLLAIAALFYHRRMTGR
jgi:uroporphyrinogen-III synthase